MPERAGQGYLAYRQELETIDDVLRRSGLDELMINDAIGSRRENCSDEDDFQSGLAAFIRHCRSAFRICLLRSLKGGSSVRTLEISLADSPLEQWFCFIENFDQIKAPAKSTIDRCKNLFSADARQRAFDQLLQKAATAAENYDPDIEAAVNLLGFELPSNLVEVWYDSTCHSPNIHFPVDWVQLGDCCRSLLKAVNCIRRHGIKNRMPRGGGDALLSALNQLLISLGNARRRKDSKKQRKAILRRLKKFAKRAERHARTHRELLEKHHGEKTNLSTAQAGEIIKRIDGVLDQLPQAIKQAHDRFIGERRIANQEKILSIYEPAVKVIKRGKSGAEVEYGNQLMIGENREGLITYYELYEDVKSDSSRVEQLIEKTEKNIQAELELIVGDRGFSDRKGSKQLELAKPGLLNHVCPKSPVELEQTKKSPGFRENQKRRAQTEARIAILTNCYQRGRSLSKGLESQRVELDWVMLAHNLRLLARKRLGEESARERDRGRKQQRAA